MQTLFRFMAWKVSGIEFKTNFMETSRMKFMDPRPVALAISTVVLALMGIGWAKEKIAM